MCIVGINELNGLTDTFPGLVVTEVVERQRIRTKTPSWRSERPSFLCGREVQAVKRWKYTKYTWDLAHKGGDYLIQLGVSNVNS